MKAKKKTLAAACLGLLLTCLSARAAELDAKGCYEASRGQFQRLKNLFVGGRDEGTSAFMSPGAVLSHHGMTANGRNGVQWVISRDLFFMQGFDISRIDEPGSPRLFDLILTKRCGTLSEIDLNEIRLAAISVAEDVRKERLKQADKKILKDIERYCAEHGCSNISGSGVTTR